MFHRHKWLYEGVLDTVRRSCINCGQLEGINIDFGFEEISLDGWAIRVKKDRALLDLLKEPTAVLKEESNACIHKYKDIPVGRLVKAASTVITETGYDEKTGKGTVELTYLSNLRDMIVRIAGSAPSFASNVPHITKQSTEFVDEVLEFMGKTWVPKK